MFISLQSTLKKVNTRLRWLNESTDSSLSFPPSFFICSDALVVLSLPLRWGQRVFHDKQMLGLEAIPARRRHPAWLTDIHQAAPRVPLID